MQNTTVAPTNADALACPAAGIHVSGPRCGSSGSAAALAYAPSKAQTVTNPSTSTKAQVAGNSVGNTTSAPTNAGAVTCPLVGVNVRGYGCGALGSGTGVVRGPTGAGASTTPAGTTNANVAGRTLNNTTTAPVSAAADTCPLVGINARGYACDSKGRATAVGYAPTTLQGGGTPSTTTQTNVGGSQLSNSTTAPLGAGASTCPLVGIRIRGYGCGNAGSATGVLFAPANGQVDTTPSSSTQGTVAGTSLNNSTTAPTSAVANTCPLVGVNVRGYGCGAPGSASSVIFAPTTGGIQSTPVSGTTGSIAGATLNNTTATPTGAGLAACPLVGINVTEYGCGMPGSATGVVFAPTSGGVTTMPGAASQATRGGTGAGQTTSLPTGANLSTCPLIGIAVTGYGCGAPGSATGVITAPTGGHLTSVPSAGNQGNSGGTSQGSTIVSPTGAEIVTCSLIGINVSGYGCGAAGSPTGTTSAASGSAGSPSPVGNPAAGSPGITADVVRTNFPNAIPGSVLSGGTGNATAQGPVPAPGQGATTAVTAGQQTNSVSPSLPAAPQGKTGAPSALVAPAAPAVFAAPVVPVVPAAPVAPSALVAPAAPSAPGAPAVPAVPAAPAVPAVPAAPVAPSAPAVPAAPSAAPFGPAPLPAAPALTTPAARTGAVPSGAAPLPRVVAAYNAGSAQVPGHGLAGVMHAASGASALSVMPFQARTLSGGLSVLPRTGGGMSMRGTPAFPLLPSLLALLLVALGTLTRKLTRAL
ncbi:MAG: hypothetical protein NVS2B16_23250 [Chloroflexota bacterium]